LLGPLAAPSDSPVIGRSLDEIEAGPRSLDQREETAMRQKITKTAVDAMLPGALIWDTECRGLAVRRQADARVYLVKYRSAERRQRWLRIGIHGSPWTVETARQEVRRLLGLVAQGQDPAATKINARTAPTIADLCDRFLAEHVDAKLKPMSAASYRRIVTAIIKPKLGARLITAVTRDDVARLHHALRATPYLGNRSMAVLGKCFVLAERWGLRPQSTNPVRGIEKYREKARERYLSADELARLGEALAAGEADTLKVEDKPVTLSVFAVAALRLLIYTGARVSEILTLRWEDVDLERGVLNLRDSKTGKKSIALNVGAKAVLEALPRVDGNPHVIVGGRAGAPLVNLKDPWYAVRAAAGLTDVRMHDIRHTFASAAVDAGLSLPVIGGLLGHTQAATTKRYAHLRDAVKAEAAELVGARIAKAMGGNGHAPTTEATATRGRDGKATLRVHLLVAGAPACGRPLKPGDDVSMYVARVTCAACQRKAP
jgi:integrase